MVPSKATFAAPFDEDLTNDTQTTSHPQLLLPAFYPAYFGTDVPDLRLALRGITNNPRTHKRKDPAMTSTQHLIDHWLWLPRALPWQGFYLRELQEKLGQVHRPRSGKTNFTLYQYP